MFQLLIQPALNTRESVMVAAGRVQLSLTDDNGDTRYIKIECKAKGLPGSSKNYTPVPLDLATHVFISEKGYGTTRLGTYYPPNGKYTTGRFFNDLPEDSGHIAALKAAVNYINGGNAGDDDGGTYGIEAESKCGLCGQPLTDPVSVQRGIGPDCAGKPTGTKILHASAYADTLTKAQQLPSVTEHVEHAEAVVDPTVDQVPTAQEQADENMADRAAVVYGLDVRNWDLAKLATVYAAVQEEVAIRAAKTQNAA